MKVAAFLQMHNELEKGNLRRCLDNCRQWADYIFIYDDGSTDGSGKVYLEYTDVKNVVFGWPNDFKNEIAHKQTLLDLIHRRCGCDWIVWQDGDAVMSRDLTENMRGHLDGVARVGLRCAKSIYLNLWRHPAWVRMDNEFFGLRPICFWKYDPRLRYDSRPGLHQAQYPLGLGDPAPPIGKILHYGFASRAAIVRKYETYRQHGQSGWQLSRLIDENGLTLEKVDKDLFPLGLVPDDWDTCEKPEPITFDEVRR